MTPRQTRREFCVRVCQAASVGAVGSVLEGCGNSSPTAPSSVPWLSTINATVTNGAIALIVDAASPLSAVGSAALVQTNAGSFLVSHPAQNTFAAVTATCTHEGCTITGFTGQNYVCPCHGSRFDTSGRVVNGPANAPLRQFSAQVADNNILTIAV